MHAEQQNPFPDTTAVPNGTEFVDALGLVGRFAAIHTENVRLSKEVARAERRHSARALELSRSSDPRGVVSPSAGHD